MSYHWGADMSYPIHASTEVSLRDPSSTDLEARDAGASFADRGVARMAPQTTAGLGYMQPPASATAPLFDSSQLLIPAIPSQHRLNAVVPLDPNFRDDNDMPPYASSFRGVNSQQVPITSLPVGFPVAYDLPSMHHSAHGPHNQQTLSPAASNDRNVPIDATAFTLARFPLQNVDHLQKRQSLISIINSEWWIRNTIEPDERLLLQFMNYDKHEERWKCSFWEESNPCQRSCKGKDHAKGHVRFHLQHFPFACEPPCPRNGLNCEKRYPTPGPLHKHRIAKVECPECGMSMLQGNLQRHQEGPCRGLSRLLNSSTNSLAFYIPHRKWDKVELEVWTTSMEESRDFESLQALFPLTWPIPTPVTHLNLLQPADLMREEDLQRNSGSFRHWWTAIHATRDAVVAEQKRAAVADPVVEETLGLLSTSDARSGLQKLTYLYEAALAYFPTSFKLWKSYLQMRMLYVLGKGTKPKRAGGRKKLAEVRDALEDELVTAETWEGGLDGVVGWEEWKSLVATFERAVIWLPTMPRLWLMYFSLFQHPKCPAQLSHTHARRTFDRALRTLPPSLHSRVWSVYLLWSESKGGSTTARVYRRYLAIDPSITERYTSILLSPENPQRRPLEAAKLLLGLARQAAKGKYTSPEGKSPYQLLGDWLDVVQQYADDVGMDLEEAQRDFEAEAKDKGDVKPTTQALAPLNNVSSSLMRIVGPPQPAEEDAYDEDADPSSSRRINVEKVVERDGLELYKDQAGRLWAGLATYWSKRGEFDRAKETFEKGITSVLTVRDFTQIFDAYMEFWDSLNTALLNALESPDDEDAVAEIEADLDKQIQEFGTLIDRRPFLLNEVLIRRNPNDVQEWEKRIALWADDDEKVAETYTKALETISPKRATPNFHRLYINFAKFYEEGGTTGEAEPDLDSARKIFEKSTKVNFRLVEELAEVWCEWAELELRHENYDEAIRIIQRAAFVPKDTRISYHEQSLPVQARLFKSLKLWSFYVDLEESIGSVETTKHVYDKILELRIANAQIIVNYATFLEDNQYFEESFKVYERGVELFNFPISFEIWNIYLSKFVKRYGGSKLERTRDLFEQALEKCPQKYCKPLFLMYAKLEEDFGLATRAMAIYERAAGVVADEDKFEMFTIYIAKVTENFGLPATRPIFERAIELLPDRQTAQMCLRFASMERKLGEIDRARAVYAHASQFCDPRINPEFWAEWNQFEVETGSEDTFKEYLRIKRSVQSQYNTEASFLAAHALGGKKEGDKGAAQATGAVDPMAAAEKQATKGPSFVRASASALLPENNSEAEPNLAGGEGNEEEIQMSDED